MKTMMPSAGRRLDPPDDLAPGAQRIWRVITESLPVDYFQPQDGPHLAAYVFAAWLLEREMKRGKRSAASVDQSVQRQQSQIMARLGPQLRIPPISRFDSSTAGAANRKARRELEAEPTPEDADWRSELTRPGGGGDETVTLEEARSGWTRHDVPKQRQFRPLVTASGARPMQRELVERKVLLAVGYVRLNQLDRVVDADIGENVGIVATARV